jgi:hypothetical protein
MHRYPVKEYHKQKNKIQSTGACIDLIIKMQCIIESAHTSTIVVKTIAIIVVQLYGLSLA